MVQTAHVQTERVSPSAIKSVFGQLKSNGYSHRQIIALSQGLSEMAQAEAETGFRAPVAEVSAQRFPFQSFSLEYDLSLLGL